MWASKTLRQKQATEEELGAKYSRDTAGHARHPGFCPQNYEKRKKKEMEETGEDLEGKGEEEIQEEEMGKEMEEEEMEHRESC